SWDRGRKRELSWGPGPGNFPTAAPWVSVFGVLNGIMGFWDIAPKGIEKSLFKWVFHVRKNPLFHIFGFISVQQFQNLGNLNMVIRGNIHFKAIITDRNGSLCSKNDIYKNLDQFIDINQSHFPIIFDDRILIMGYFVAKCGHHRIIIWFSKRSENIGNGQGSKLPFGFLGPSHQKLLALFFGPSVMIVLQFLGGGGEDNMGRNFYFLTGRNQFLDQFNIGGIDYFGVLMSVHGGQMDYGITC